MAEKFVITPPNEAVSLFSTINAEMVDALLKAEFMMKSTMRSFIDGNAVNNLNAGLRAFRKKCHDFTPVSFGTVYQSKRITPICRIWFYTKY